MKHIPGGGGVRNASTGRYNARCLGEGAESYGYREGLGSSRCGSTSLVTGSGGPNERIVGQPVLRADIAWYGASRAHASHSEHWPAGIVRQPGKDGHQPCGATHMVGYYDCQVLKHSLLVGCIFSVCGGSWHATLVCMPTAT
jgi:hypothetical protein